MSLTDYTYQDAKVYIMQTWKGSFENYAMLASYQQQGLI